MYDEKVTKIGVNWKSLIVKIVLLVLFIVLVVWLFPKSDVDVFYDKIFNDNIQTMKEAARNYYTLDRLPANIGDSTKMTLGEMFEKRMILQFRDKDNNLCDEENSYVQVTKKSDTEYVLKVQLSCGEQVDYILDTIGCNDVCQGNDCIEEEKPVDQELTISSTYYRHRKPIVTSSVEFSCPATYTLSGNKCVKKTALANVSATAIYKPDQTITTDAKVNSGSSYKEYVTPIRRTSYSYSCPSGYSQNGSYCVKYTAPIENKGESKYVCPSDYSLIGTACVKTYNATYNAGSTTYSCPSGYTQNGTQCISKINATVETSYTCPSGYTKSGSSCYVVTAATPNTTYGSWALQDTQYYTTSNKAYTGTTSKLVYEGMITGAVCGTPCGNSGIWYKYSYYTRTSNTSYSCPSGYTLSGTQCKKTISATKNTSYTCPSGYTRNGTTCTKTIDATKNTSNGTYSCPNGGFLSGDKCVLSQSATLQQEESTYVCPYGTKSVNGQCEETIDADVEHGYYYTCPSGYTRSGSGSNTKCYKVVKSKDTYYCEDANATLKGNKCVKTVKGELSHYTCPTGYNLEGKICTSTKVETINATSTTKTATSYKYTWSSESKLEGWEFTGETKTETQTVVAVK